MSLPKIDIDNASAAECVEYAATHLGMRIAANAKDETARAKLKDMLEAAGEEQAPAEQVQLASINREDPNPAPVRPLGKRVKIMVPKSKTDKRPVTVSVNFKTFLIQRGVEVEVPEAVVEALRNAVVQEYDEDMKETQAVPAEPFQILGLAE